MRRQIPLLLALLVSGGLLAAGAALTRDRWGRLFWPEPAEAAEEHGHAHGGRVKLSPQARRNLGLVVGPAELKASHWCAVPVPGVVVDRPAPAS